MLKTIERIVTLTDLQRNAGTVVENAQVEPVAVTLRGRPVVYVVGVDQFDRMTSQLAAQDARELELGIALSEKQFAAGESVTLEALEAEFGLPAEDA